MSDVITGQTVGVLPEYQERFFKDLLANVYRTEQRQAIDPETGELRFDEAGEPIMESYATGIAATSPLFGQPQFERKIDPVTGEPMVDARGDPVFDETKPIYRRDSQGNLILDLRGQPIQETIGGIPRPDVVPFTPAQEQAIELGLSGIGAYAPLLEEAKGTYESGLAALETGFDPTTGQALAYDPMSYKSFYDPFVEEVIDSTQRDIQRAADIERDRSAGQAVRQGAFGGSRAAVAEQEIQRAADDRAARTGAQLRSAAYTGAQQQAQSAFENQLKRGQSGSQIFQNLGTSQAGLGQLAQRFGYQDVKNLFDIGGIEQTQRQSEYDVQRQGAIETAYEPFQRFSYASDIFRGVPSTQTTLTVGSAPEQNVLGSTVGTAMGLGAYQQQYGGGQSILGGLMNR
jgi:hypothetical protein